MALTKVSGNILDPGINVAGVVTATRFDGPFSDLTTTELNVTGISTFNNDVEFVGPTAGLTSVTWDKSANSLHFKDNVSAVFGTDSDGSIKHTGTNLQIFETTGNIQVTNYANDKDVDIKSDDGSGGTALYFKADGSTGETILYNYGNEKIKTTGYGVTITGGITVGAALTVQGDLYVEGTRTEVKSATLEITDKTIGISSTASPSDTTADGAGIVVYGATDKSLKWENSSDSWLSSEHIKLPDNKKAIFGAAAGGYLEVYNSGSDSFIKSHTDDLWIYGHDNIILAGTTSDHKYLRTVDSGGVFLYHNNSVKIETTSSGVTVTGEVASSQDYPTIRPTLDLNFAAVKKLDPRITYSRTGPASYTDEFGKVVLVGDNTPRFDHDPATRECKGLLIEESRTNYVRQSLTLATDWSAGGGSYAYDAAITNPDGSVGAYYHTGAELYHSNIDLSGASTNVAIISMWVKARSGQTGVMDIQLYQQISGTVVDMGAFAVNPVTGTVTTNGARWSDGKVTEYPNGWYRFSAKATTASGNFTSSTRVDLQNNEHYVWGMQVEVGSFVTSFIPTNGATSTRGADLCQITGQEFSDFYNQTEGTIVTEHSIATGVASGDNTYVYQIDDGSDTNVGWRLLDHNSAHGDLLRAYGFVGGAWGSPQYGFDSATPAHNTFLKVALGMKNNDFGINFFGGTTATDTSGSVTGNGDMVQLTIGNHRGGTAPLQGHMRRFIYYPQKLTTNQLKTITS